MAADRDETKKLRFQKWHRQYFFLRFLPKSWLHAICYLLFVEVEFLSFVDNLPAKNLSHHHCVRHEANYGFNRPMLDLVFDTYKRTNKLWIDVNDARYKKEMVALGYRCWSFQNSHHQVIICFKLPSFI